jgi:signal transduction histidine kinase
MPHPPTNEPLPCALTWWDAAAVVVSLVTFLACAATGITGTSVLIAGVDLGVFLLAYALLGRGSLDGRRGWIVFTAVIVGVSFVGSLQAPSFATFQTIAYPLVWIAAPDLRRAIPGNVAVAVAVASGYAVSSRSITEAVVVEGFTLVFSLAMGIWISGIAKLSEQRKELLDQLTAAQDQVAALHREQGVVSERVRLARELHDTIAQSLTGIVMLAERARAQHPDDASLGVLEESARQALTETRGLVAATAPVPLEGGLRAAMALLGDRFTRETGVAVTATVGVEIPRGLEVVLLRCAQEGLANVRKHAHADSASIAVRPDGDGVRLTVTDDGVGFDRTDLDGGFGLSGMRDRLALVGGDVALRHAEPRGTVLDVRVPLESPAPAAAPAPAVLP